MNKPMVDVREIMEKSGDADLLLAVVGLAAERLKELEVDARTGAAKGCVLVGHSMGLFDD